MCRLLITTIAIALATTANAQSSATDEGFTEPLKTVLLAAPESGVIQAIAVREGDLVKRGEVICKLNSSVLEVSLKAAQAKLESKGKINAAQSTLDNKLHHLKQMQELLAKQHASDKEVRQAQLEFDLAKANLESANDEVQANEIEVKRIEAQIERRVIRASTDGVVLELPRQEGEAITTSEGHVATIVRLDQLRVRYFLTTGQAAGMNRGDSTTVNFPATNQNATAQVDFVAPVTDSNSGTVRVELLIDNRNGLYQSGLRCTLTNARSTIINTNGTMNPRKSQ